MPQIKSAIKRVKTNATANKRNAAELSKLRTAVRKFNEALENKVSLSKLTVLLKQAIELDFGYKNGTYHGDEFLKLFLLKI